ncbi:MAG: glycine cleavage system protein GcvH [Lentisphaerae bacterium]|nr:glycine cleavage system protein GcvH [Lentisphaerota bacterium]
MKYYSSEHEWVQIDGDDAYVGVSRYIVDKLGDISYVELPKEGTDVIVGDDIGVIESITESEDVYSPISGTIIAVNHNLDDDPTILNEHCEDKKGWLCKLENIDLAELDDLMDEEAYERYTEKLGF